MCGRPSRRLLLPCRPVMRFRCRAPRACNCVRRCGGAGENHCRRRKASARADVVRASESLPEVEGVRRLGSAARRGGCELRPPTPMADASRGGPFPALVASSARRLPPASPPPDPASSGLRRRRHQAAAPRRNPRARGRQRPEMDGVGEPVAAGSSGTVVLSLLLSVGDFCRCGSVDSWRHSHFEFSICITFICVHNKN
jgi:hypothetical protein